MRKGQAATEYLIILAVVVIIALIVVGVLGGFQGISGGVTRAQSEVYWNSVAPAIGIKPNYRIGGDAAELTIRNNKPFLVRVTSIRLNDAGQLSPSSITLARGNEANVNITGIEPCNTGRQYEYKVSMTYLDPSTNRQFTFTGETSLVGECQ